MSKFLALCAFVGVLVQSGNLGFAVVGAIFIWLWTNWAFSPVKMIGGYDKYGSRDEDGKYSH